MGNKVDIIKGIPYVKSTDADWLNWHKALKARFGKGEAGRLWVARWQKQRSTAANTSDLRYYLSSQGIAIKGDGLFDGFTDAYTTASKGFDDFGKYVGIGMIVVAVIIVLAAFKVFTTVK